MNKRQIEDDAVIDRVALASRISEFISADRVAYGGKTSLPFAEKYVVELVPDEFEPWIYDYSGNYRIQVGQVLFVAEQVRKAGAGYREFRRQLGNYSGASGCIMRSQITSWSEDIKTLLKKGKVLSECVSVTKYLWLLTAAAQKV